MWWNYQDRQEYLCCLTGATNAADVYITRLQSPEALDTYDHHERWQVCLLWSRLSLEDFVSDVSIDVEVRSVYVVVTVIKVLWEIMVIYAVSFALLFVYIDMNNSRATE